MLKTRINIVAIVIDTSTSELSKSFISSCQDKYEPISFDTVDCEDCDTMTRCLAKLMNKYVLDVDTRLLQYHQLSCTKTQDCIYINYAVVIPSYIRLASNTILKSYNVSILNPLARKSLAYV